MTFNWDISFDIIALISAIVAFIMFLLSYKERKKAKEYAENANGSNISSKRYFDLMVDKLLKDESGESNSNMANCDADIIKIEKSRYILRITNKGNSKAVNVDFKFIDDDSPSIYGDGFPVQIIDEQKSVDLELGIYLSLSSRSWGYEITWTNEDSTKGMKEGSLTLPLV